MKKLVWLLFALAVWSATLIAQQTPPAAPPTPAALEEIANKVVDAINRQDAAALTSMVAPDAIYLDEDGHAPPVARWIQRLTTGAPPKKLTISGMRGQMWDNGGWVSFNYVLSEQLNNAPFNVKGTASIVVKKPAGAANWQIALIHGALEQKVAGITQ